MLWNISKKIKVPLINFLVVATFFKQIDVCYLPKFMLHLGIWVGSGVVMESLKYSSSKSSFTLGTSGR